MFQQSKQVHAHNEEFQINNFKNTEMRLTNRIKQAGERLDTFYFGFSEFRFRFCSLSFCSEVAHKRFGSGPALLKTRYEQDQRYNFTHMKLETLKDLYIHELKDLYSAEKQIINALPKMVKAATDEQLAAGFEEHFEQTKEHAARLEKILTSHDESTRGPKCEGMEGVLKEGDEMIKEDAEDEVRDAGLIAAAQRVEHYEMAGYGCARTYAELLGDRQGAQLLQTTLMEESDTDKKLTKLAKSVINVAAK